MHLGELRSRREGCAIAVGGLHAQRRDLGEAHPQGRRGGAVAALPFAHAVAASGRLGGHELHGGISPSGIGGVVESEGMTPDVSSGALPGTRAWRRSSFFCWRTLRKASFWRFTCP